MSRGTYRGFFSALFDDPDFQALSADARLCLLVSRGCRQAGPAAIFICYPSVLMIQTGLPAPRVESALSELEIKGWIEREGSVLWIRNGLRYDPSMRLSDKKHLRSVERALSELPRLAIVLRFCDYYKIPRPFDGPSKTMRELALLKPDPEYRSLRPDPEDRTPKTKSFRPHKNGAGPTDGSVAWEGYRSAYRQRYQVDPIRNAKVNSQFSQLVQRIPADEAPQVSAYYVTNNNGRYVRAGHSVDCLLQDAEKLRTEWATGRRTTETQARQADRTDSLGQAARELIEEAEHGQ